MFLISRERANCRIATVGILLILGITAIDFGCGGLINRKAGENFKCTYEYYMNPFNIIWV